MDVVKPVLVTSFMMKKNKKIMTLKLLLINENVDVIAR